MAFFDLPSDEELTPEARQAFEEYRRLTGASRAPAAWRTYGRIPRIVQARVRAYEALSHRCSFSPAARNVAVMLMAHAKRCRACFMVSRRELDRLGFDEETLEGMCANPDALPLDERERLFVHYALKIATGAADLQPKDFREMAANGFSPEDVQETIAFVAYWVMTMVFTQATGAALADE